MIVSSSAGISSHQSSKIALTMSQSVGGSSCGDWRLRRHEHRHECSHQLSSASSSSPRPVSSFTSFLSSSHCRITSPGAFLLCCLLVFIASCPSLSHCSPQQDVEPYHTATAINSLTPPASVPDFNVEKSMSISEWSSRLDGSDRQSAPSHSPNSVVVSRPLKTSSLERPYVRSIFAPSPYVTTPGPVFINFTRLMLNRMAVSTERDVTTTVGGRGNRIERKYIFIDKRPASTEFTTPRQGHTSGRFSIPDPSRKKTLVKVKMVNGNKQTLLFDKSTPAPEVSREYYSVASTTTTETPEVTTTNLFYKHFKSLTPDPFVDLENNLQKRSEFELRQSTNRFRPSRINSKMAQFDTTTTPLPEETTTTTTTETPTTTLATTTQEPETSPPMTSTEQVTTPLITNDFSSIAMIVTEPETESPPETTTEPSTESHLEVIETTTPISNSNVDINDFGKPEVYSGSGSQEEHRCTFDMALLCPGMSNDRVMCFGAGEIDCDRRWGENCRLSPAGSDEYSSTSGREMKPSYLYCNYPLKTRRCRGVTRCESDQLPLNDPSSVNVPLELTTQSPSTETPTEQSLLGAGSLLTPADEPEPTKNPLKQNQNSSAMSSLKVALISGLVAVGVLVIIAVAIVAFVSWQKLKVGPVSSSQVTLNGSDEFYDSQPTVIHVNGTWNANRRIS